MVLSTDSKTSANQLLEKGFKILSNDELKKRILDKTVLGDYYNGRKYITYIDKIGTLEGKNDLGTHSFGEWNMNNQNSTLHVEWDTYWDTHTTHAFDIDGQIKFYDSDTGKWRTTFTKLEDGKKVLEF